MPKAPKKKSSKASSPSWRTLMRQAEKAEARARRSSGANRKGLLAGAAGLREQAASIRRSERAKVTAKASAKRGGAKRRRAAKVTSAEQGLQGLVQGINREENPSWQNTALQAREQPGHGEIVGGEMAKLADEIAALAGKKGGKDEIQSKLMMATATAKYEGERKADQRHMTNVKDIHEATTDKIVCAALAVFDSDPQFRNGLPPAIMISSYTLCRMIDALNRAGYTSKGRS